MFAEILMWPERQFLYSRELEQTEIQAIVACCRSRGDDLLSDFARLYERTQMIALIPIGVDALNGNMLLLQGIYSVVLLTDDEPLRSDLMLEVVSYGQPRNNTLPRLMPNQAAEILDLLVNEIMLIPGLPREGR